MNLNFQLNNGSVRDMGSSSAVTFPSAVAEGAFPLAAAQTLMLSDSLRRPNAGVYLEQIICRADGELDPWAFARAWQHTVDCNDILRTSYRWENLAAPLQVVERAATLPFQQYDWSEQSESEQGECLECLIRDDRAAGFDFLMAPLSRLTLIRVAEKSYLLLWSLHLSILDGWSQALILKQVLTAYRGLVRGALPQIGSGRPYRDYVELYDGRRFEQAAIQQLLTDLRTMLAAFVFGPTTTLAELQLPTQERTAAKFFEWN